MADYDTVISKAAYHGNDVHHHGVSHVVPVKVLLGVWLALMVGTVVTVAVTYLDLGRASIYVALAIALVKATLVAVYFMHLRYDKPFNALVFVGCLIFVTLFIGLSMSDSAAYRAEVQKRQAPSLPYPTYGAGHAEAPKSPAGGVSDVHTVTQGTQPAAQPH